MRRGQSGNSKVIASLVSLWGYSEAAQKQYSWHPMGQDLPSESRG